MLNEINRFLEDQNLSVFMINDSVKALVEIIRIKPDLILLDVGMPMVDGYKLCRLIRNHSLFKTTPVVMVTGNTGIIDRAKAKLVGATDYMTKPFTQSELLKMVFRYLT
jgi:twitching motility two-component system response regulator PilG